MPPYLNDKDRGKETDIPKSRHHIYERCHGGLTTQDNIIKLYDDVHKSYHRIFGAEKVREVMLQVLKINGPALNTEFTHDMMKVLKESSDEFYYKRGLYHKK